MCLHAFFSIDEASHTHVRQGSLLFAAYLYGLFFACFVLSADNPRKQRGLRLGPKNQSILMWIRAIWHILLNIFFCFQATLIAG